MRLDAPCRFSEIVKKKKLHVRHVRGSVPHKEIPHGLGGECFAPPPSTRGNFPTYETYEKSIFPESTQDNLGDV